MRRFGSVVLALVLLSTLLAAQQKPKKHSSLPALFFIAHYVYVKAQDGDITRPGLFPEDRQAICDVQNGVEDWNRYVLTTRQEQADLVFLVRKGRFAAAQGRGSISAGSPVPPTRTSPGQPGQLGQGPLDRQDGDSLGARTEVGPSDDMLEIFSMNPTARINAICTYKW